MDVEERTKICKLIEAVIAADGVIAVEEREFLRRVAQRFEIPYEVIAVGPVGDHGPVSDPGRSSALLRQLSTDKQARVMALLVESAVTDGEVHPSEHALLLVAAAALGIDAAAVEERIAKRLAHVTAGS
jgi:uncharacterized tellurite resistance protein B-like protein